LERFLRQAHGPYSPGPSARSDSKHCSKGGIEDKVNNFKKLKEKLLWLAIISETDLSQKNEPWKLLGKRRDRGRGWRAWNIE
jgi:hypothetical protein